MICRERNRKTENIDQSLPQVICGMIIIGRKVFFFIYLHEYMMPRASFQSKWISCSFLRDSDGARKVFGINTFIFLLQLPHSQQTIYDTAFSSHEGNGYFSLCNFSCVQVCHQRYRRRFIRERLPALLALLIIPLIFALCTHAMHGNR